MSFLPFVCFFSHEFIFFMSSVVFIFSCFVRFSVPHLYYIFLHIRSLLTLFPSSCVPLSVSLFFVCLSTGEGSSWDKTKTKNMLKFLLPTMQDTWRMTHWCICVWDHVCKYVSQCVSVCVPVSLCVDFYVCVNLSVSVYASVLVCLLVPTCLSVCLLVRIYAGRSVSLYISMSICLLVCVCLLVCLLVFTHLC